MVLRRTTFHTGAIVIPFYNESSRLNRSYLDSLLKKLIELDCCVYLVDDGSSDSTYCLLSEMTKGFPSSISVLKLPTNVGKGNAVRSGILRAIQENPKISMVGFVDCDGAFSIRDIENLVQHWRLEPSDVLIGSRVKLAGLNISRTWYRHLIGRIVSTVLNIAIIPHTIYDPQSGLKLFSNTTFLSNSISGAFHTRWFADVELIARLHNSKTKYREIPLASWTDIPGSHIKWSAFLEVLMDLLLLILNVKLKNRSFKNGLN